MLVHQYFGLDCTHHTHHSRVIVVSALTTLTVVGSHTIYVGVYCGECGECTHHSRVIAFTMVTTVSVFKGLAK